MLGKPSHRSGALNRARVVAVVDEAEETPLERSRGGCRRQVQNSKFEHPFLSFKRSRAGKDFSG
jgi:hypothetical protein